MRSTRLRCLAAGSVTLAGVLVPSLPIVLRERSAAFRRPGEVLDRTVHVAQRSAGRELAEAVTLSARIKLVWPDGVVRVLDPGSGLVGRGMRLAFGWAARWWRPRPAATTWSQVVRGEARSRA